MTRSAVVALAIIAALAGAGCAGRKTVSSEKPRLNTHLSLPDFVLNPRTVAPASGETFLFGSGQCAVYESEADADLAITTADNLARQKILAVVRNTLGSGYQYYAAIAGNTNPEVSKAYNNALLAEGALELPGAEIVKREYRDGVIFSSARWSQSAANVNAAIESLRKTLASQEATRAMSQAQPVWDRLRQDIKNAQSR